VVECLPWVQSQHQEKTQKKKEMQPNQGVFRCHHLPAHASEPSLRGLDNGDKNLLLQDFGGGLCVCVAEEWNPGSHTCESHSTPELLRLFYAASEELFVICDDIHE
jgi:hypothetical protein